MAAYLTRAESGGSHDERASSKKKAADELTNMRTKGDRPRQHFRGSIWGSMGKKKIGDSFVVFCGVSYGIFGFLWFIKFIGLRWPIKAWGHIPIFSDMFGTFRNSAKKQSTIDLCHSFFIKKHSKTRRKRMGTSFKTYYFCMPDFSKI